MSSSHVLPSLQILSSMRRAGIGGGGASDITPEDIESGATESFLSGVGNKSSPKPQRQAITNPLSTSSSSSTTTRPGPSARKTGKIALSPLESVVPPQHQQHQQQRFGRKQQPFRDAGDHIGYGGHDRRDATGKKFRVQVPKKLLFWVALVFLLLPIMAFLYVLITRVFSSKNHTHNVVVRSDGGNGGSSLVLGGNHHHHRHHHRHGPPNENKISEVAVVEDKLDESANAEVDSLALDTSQKDFSPNDTEEKVPGDSGLVDDTVEGSQKGEKEEENQDKGGEGTEVKAETKSEREGKEAQGTADEVKGGAREEASSPELEKGREEDADESHLPSAKASSSDKKEGIDERAGDDVSFQKAPAIPAENEDDTASNKHDGSQAGAASSGESGNSSSNQKRAHAPEPVKGDGARENVRS